LEDVATEPLFHFDDEILGNPKCSYPNPNIPGNGLGVEQPVHVRNIREEQLQNGHPGGSTYSRWIAKDADVKHRLRQRAAVE
jgi:hypothetical protein